MQCDAEKAEHPLKLSAKNTQHNWQPFKFWVFYRPHWAH